MDELKSEVEIPSVVAAGRTLLRSTPRTADARLRQKNGEPLHVGMAASRRVCFARAQNLGNNYSRNLAMRFKEVYGSASGRVSRGAQAGFES